ncbi:MAG TPA: cyclase family protein [Acidimicrobiales bacterium]|nr:cyclase family protein [Acidimicrobiales bacterium]
MARDFVVPTTTELDRLFDELESWDRWGREDERGTLNHLTPARTARAAALVTSGEVVSLAHDLATEPLPEHPHPVQHHMLASGDARDSNGIEGYEAARDHLALDVHGLWTTHVDALSHMFVDGRMYGGRPASEVRSDGARSNTVLTLAEGVVGRGVLLDVPRALGVDFLDTGEVVSVADLEATEAALGVEVGAGDVVVVAWGREARRRARKGFDGFSGLHPECLAWLAQREVAVLGSDGISDPMPFLGVPRWPFPVHQIGMVAMGLPLIDNVAVERLGRHCAARGSFAFLFTMGPLRIPGGTGCPVNPVAVL